MISFNHPNLLIRHEQSVFKGYPLRLSGVERPAESAGTLSVSDPQPIFAAVFAEQWDSLPPALRLHYANRPFSNDVVTHEGHLTITMSPFMRNFRWLLRLAGVLIPIEGDHIPCTVYSRSDPKSNAYILDRWVYPPGGKPYNFRSELVPTGEPHRVIEYFRFGGGWRASYSFEDGQVHLRHLGYNWRLFGHNIPLPGWLRIFAGTGHAVEQVLSDDSYTMRTALSHGLHKGPLIGYAGDFRVTEVRLAE